MPASKKLCEECGEELYAIQMPRHMMNEHGIQVTTSSGKPFTGRAESSGAPSSPSLGVEAGASGDSNVSRETIEEPPPEPPTETAPRRPRLFDRLKSRRGRGRVGGQQAPVPGERAPKRKGVSRKRVPLDTDISDIWAFGGRRLERTPHYPTGRMLQYQAPAAGVIIDRAVAGTLPDRVLFQPIARNRDKYEDVAFLLAGPLLTFSITATGQQMERARAEQDWDIFNDLANKLTMQQEMFTWVVRMMLPRLAEGVKKAREKKAKDDAVILDAFPELAAGDDPVDTFCADMFAPPFIPQEEASQNGSTHQPAADPDRQDWVAQ